MWITAWVTIEQHMEAKNNPTAQKEEKTPSIIKT